MRIVVAAVIAIVAAACGPSGREVAYAKLARFDGNQVVLFSRMQQAVALKYKLERADETKGVVQTVARWYNPEGQGISAAGPEDYLNMPDRSIKLALVAELLPEGKRWVVLVRPVMIRYRTGQSAPDPLPEGDPSLPGWVPGKVDQLQYAIYEALKKYEAKGPPPAAPLGPEPTSDPDEPASRQPPAESAPPAPTAPGTP